MLESQLILGWIKRGEELGRLKHARELCRDFLSFRFENPVPEDMLLVIEETSDDKILTEWVLLAGTGKTLSEVREAMKLTP